MTIAPTHRAHIMSSVPHEIGADTGDQIDHRTGHA